MKVAARKRLESRPLIPGWCIMFAIPVTAVVTIWALRGSPGQGAPQEVPMQVQAYPAGPAPAPHAMSVPQVIAPQVIGVPPVTGAGLQKVAAVRSLPPVIVAGSQRPHLDRGNCTLCHTVVRPNGARMPTLRSSSIMPHAYPGGQCINCHTTIPPLPGFTGVALPVGMQPMQNNLKMPEAKWKGMEVAPISPLTAMQFGTPAGIKGAVVTEVEGKAAMAGVRMGDVVMGVNGAPVTDVMSFNAATQNGALSAGAVQVLRGGSLIEVPIDQVQAGASVTVISPAGQGVGCASGTVPGRQINEDRTRGMQGVQGAQGMQGLRQGEDNRGQLLPQGGVGVMNMGVAPARAAIAPAQNGAAPF